MTTMVEVRGALVSQMQDNWAYPEVKVIYDNKTVDMDRVGKRFIRFTVNFDDTVQANIAPNPFHRYYGRVEIDVFTESGLGVVTTLSLVDALMDIFKCKVLAGKVHTQVPTPSRVEEHDGWHCFKFMVPFFADSNT